ncbi:ABC transporter substrate-binding protein [Castellaniella hirudinis]|uniref:ABC transporter substrate-binding protein n=1 Tax=Castellaniella hirudinis TaxID=1144617 RepID=UPI0039C3F0B1
MKKTFIHLAAGATTALFCAGLISPALAADIKIGVLVPLTGTSAIQGKDISRGIQLAAQRINQGFDIPQKDGSTIRVDPKVLGGEIKLVIEDTESRPASALDAMRKLVNVDKVPVVLGVLSSGVCVPTGQFAQQAKVVEICSSSTSPELRKIGPYLFSTMGLDDLMGRAVAEFAQGDSGGSTLATLSTNNPFGVGMEIQACQQLESAGKGKCVTKVRYEEGKSDYNADLRRTVSQDPDMVMFTAYGAEARLLMQEAYQQGIQVGKNWYADYPSLWITDIEKTPEIGEGIKGLEPGSAGPAYDAYSADYKQAFGESPTSVFGSYAYDSAMLVALAIQQAGAANADAIRDALTPVSQNYAGVTGDKAFDEDGMQKTESYRHVIVKDGKLLPYQK